MPKLKLSLIEKLTLVLIALILIVAFGLFVFNPFLLDVYLEEDGIVEWLTVAGLLAGFGICIYRFIKLVKVKNWWVKKFHGDKESLA
jgi:uncharacterized membrane protein